MQHGQNTYKSKAVFAMIIPSSFWISVGMAPPCTSPWNCRTNDICFEIAKPINRSMVPMGMGFTGILWYFNVT